MKIRIFFILFFVLSLTVCCKSNDNIINVGEKVTFTGVVKVYGNDKSFIGQKPTGTETINYGIASDDGKLYNIHADYKDKVVKFAGKHCRFTGYLIKNSSTSGSYFLKDGTFIPGKIVRINEK